MHRKLARGVSKDSPALRPDERGDAKQSVGERGVRQEVHCNRKTLVWERELTSDVARAIDGQGTTGGPTMPPDKLGGYCEVREAPCGPQSVLCPLRVFLPFLLFFLLGCREGAGVAAPENGEAVDWAIMNACWALRWGNSVAIVCCAIAGWAA